MRLTDDAATMINALVAAQDLPDGAGLRIAQRDDHDALAMGLADAPGPDDLVVFEGEASVFLGPIAQQRLAGSVLDARQGELGPAFFVQP
jgi:Fe-S cluster assembly iron-binding protein IscA